MVNTPYKKYAMPPPSPRRSAEPWPSRSRPHLCHLVYLASVLAWAGFGCTLAPRVSVSEGAAKSAASELGTGMEGAAKTFGTELAHASQPYEEELLARVKDLTLSATQLVQASRDMPKAFGEAVTDRLVKEKSFRDALHGFFQPEGSHSAGEAFA